MSFVPVQADHPFLDQDVLRRAFRLISDSSRTTNSTKTPNRSISRRSANPLHPPTVFPSHSPTLFIVYIGPIFLLALLLLCKIWIRVFHS